MLYVLLLHKYTHSPQIVCPDFCFEDRVILTTGHLQRLRGPLKLFQDWFGVGLEPVEL